MAAENGGGLGQDRAEDRARTGSAVGGLVSWPHVILTPPTTVPHMGHAQALKVPTFHGSGSAGSASRVEPLGHAAAPSRRPSIPTQSLDALFEFCAA